MMRLSLAAALAATTFAPASFAADTIPANVVAAVNDARGKMDALAADEMKKLTGGLQLPPGMKLPFNL